MNTLRLYVTALVLNLALFYNIERLDVYAVDLVNIPTFVYVLAVVVVLSIVAVAKSWRVSMLGWMLSWMTVYLLLKLFVFTNRPVLGGMYTYITITEIVFLLLTILLSYRVAFHLHDFEDAVENITFAGVRERVLPYQEGVLNAKTEMYRGRRYERPISVVVMEPEPESIKASLHRSVQKVQQSMMSRYIYMGLARVVSQEMRRMDIAIEHQEQGRLVVLCPETNGEGANAMVKRIRKTASEQLGVSFEVGIASFPGEAVTFEELLNRAENQLKESSSNSNGPLSSGSNDGEKKSEETAQNQQVGHHKMQGLTG